MERQLTDSLETYRKTIKGKCNCGHPILKTLGSNITVHSNGDRFHYKNDNTASCVYRCDNCKETIHTSFNVDKK